MGKYLNPGNSGFIEMLSSDYIDKTGLIAKINRTIGTKNKLTCVSRPRRFGKSYAAQMLCAYYDCSCDSLELFRSLEIGGTPDFYRHLNQYHVICLDIAGALSEIKRTGGPISRITGFILEDLKQDFIQADPELERFSDTSECLKSYVEKTGRKIIFVIDEWDAVIREARHNEGVQSAYLNLLRSWFKNINFTPHVVAAAYMTGILPIKKDGSQSAISDFIEYPVLYPDGIAEYTGFTEEEVRGLCAAHHMDFSEFQTWYDGYHFSECGSIYNPYSVMRAVQNGKCRSYWQKTSAAEALLSYVNMDFDGLQETIARLITGEAVEVNVNTFENDFETFKSKDDVMTLLIHLGYLTYQEEERLVAIPNEEVRLEFRQLLDSTETNPRWMRLIQKSRQLLSDTIAGKEEAVAAAITEIRNTNYAPLFYNDEQALRSVIKFAYLTAFDSYLKVEELPSGRGIADVVFLPKRKTNLPAMIIELKWDRSAGGAIAQIRKNDYPAILKEYDGEILLVGINYSTRTKEHSCRIEAIQSA